MNKKAFRGASGNCSKWRHSPTQDNQVFLHCGGSRICKGEFEIYSSEKSWRSHRGERVHNSVHKFIPAFQALKILDAKDAVSKELKNSRTFLLGSWIK